MKLRYIVCVIAVIAASAAQADIYKCVDDAGRMTYTNDKPPPTLKNCSLLTKELPVNTIAGPKRAAATPTPSGFPKVDDSTQRNRDNDRRRILEQELSDEEKALEEAQKELSQQDERRGDEKNFQKYLDRLQPYKEKAELHERNVEAIRKELSKLR